QVTVRRGGRDRRLVTREPKGDAVGDLESGILPRLLHRAHDVTGEALRLKLRRRLGVEENEAAAAQERHGPVLVAGLEHELELLSAERDAIDLDRVARLRPVALLRGAYDALNVF